MERRADMLVPKQAFGVCALSNYIYVGGGVMDNSTYLKCVQRYDLLKDEWEALSDCDLPKEMFAMTFLAVRRRYIYSFGESQRFFYTDKAYDFETFYKLDTANLSLGWQVTKVNSPYKFIGCQYGILPLRDIQDWRGTDISQFLVFGGISQSYEAEVLKRTFVVEINNKDFSKI